MRGPGREGSATALTRRAPEEVAPLEDPGPDGGPAHVAGLTVAAIDVDLAAVVVHARRTAHRRRLVLGPHGVDPAGDHAVPHQSHQVVPDGVPAALAHLRTGGERVEPGPE